MKLYTDEELAEILNQELFHQISEAADRLGVECYVVGGYVRDIFLERPSNDIDVVVVGSGISVAQELKRMLGRKAHLSVFKNFGTAQVKIRRQESGVRRQESGVRRQENTPATDSSLQGNLPTPDSCLLTPQFLEVEFVGARKESYSHDSRKPIVEDGTLEDDQNRRDFTINAMAICLNKDRFGELVDPFNGLADLEDGIIATPLEPDITFSDDPLRMMRCIRFATQLNFQIEDETFVALERMAERIKINVGAALTDLGENAPEDYVVHGPNRITALPMAVPVCYQEIAHCLEKTIAKIETAVLNALEETPPELYADIVRNGIYLTGGGALLRGLDKRLTDKLNIPFHIADDPLHSVAKGTGVALKNIENFSFLM